MNNAIHDMRCACCFFVKYATNMVRIGEREMEKIAIMQSEIRTHDA